MRDHEDAFTAFYLTESFLYRIVPVFAISTLNVFIIVRLWRITRDRKRLLAASSRSVALTVTTTTTTKTRTTSHRPLIDATELTPVNNDNDKHGTYNASRDGLSIIYLMCVCHLDYYYCPW